MQPQFQDNRQTVSSSRSSGTPSLAFSPTEASFPSSFNSNRQSAGSSTNSSYFISPVPSAQLSSATQGVSSPLQQYSIPEDSSVDTAGYVNSITTSTSKVTISNGYSSIQNTPMSKHSAIFNSISPEIQSQNSLLTQYDFPPRPSTSPNFASIGSRSNLTMHEEAKPMPPLPMPQGIEKVNTAMTQFADGLILADEAIREADACGPRPAFTREPDLNIGPKSSIYHFKGFCDGAREVQKGPRAQGIKHTAGYGSSRAVGRCVRCEYNRDLAEVDMDFGRDPLVNSCLSGVLFRPRFLWKSHLSTADTARHMYGCLFCTTSGRVTNECDATVFPNQTALFRHLASHPQPLPHVAGVVVLYGKVEKSNPLIEDYDVHFPDPPVATTMPDEAMIAGLPIAIAVKSHMLRPGEKRLVDPDGVDALKFYEGARIVGIKFPERFGGKWAYGWHDGVRGAFPIKHVEIDLPGRNEFPLQGGRGFTGVVRWKWEPKDKESWLPLGKKEVISNIGWIHRDHWCWSGVDAKGKFGVFPSSHIEPLSLREEQIFPVSRTNSSLSGGDSRTTKKQTRGFFGIRRRTSNAASVSSSSTDVRDVREII